MEIAQGIAQETCQRSWRSGIAKWLGIGSNASHVLLVQPIGRISRILWHEKENESAVSISATQGRVRSGCVGLASLPPQTLHPFRVNRTV
jgi:hypothetical protein